MAILTPSFFSPRAVFLQILQPQRVLLHFLLRDLRAHAAGDVAEQGQAGGFRHVGRVDIRPQGADVVEPLGDRRLGDLTGEPPLVAVGEDAPDRVDDLGPARPFAIRSKQAASVGCFPPSSARPHRRKRQEGVGTLHPRRVVATGRSLGRPHLPVKLSLALPPADLPPDRPSLGN